MAKSLNVIGLLTLLVVVVSCVPTSVLVDTKEAKIESSNKVKRAPAPLKPESEDKSHEMLHGKTQKYVPTPHKRGISSQVLPIDLSNDILVNNLPNNGVWDEQDAGILYPDLQELEEQYQRKANRQKSYENLQNILNSQLYSEPIALPLEYPYRYYGDRKKRSSVSNSAKKTLRLKRENKLTPADMIALIALLEAEERSRYGDEQNEDLSNSLLPYEYYPTEENNGEWLNSYVEPNVDFYGLSPNNAKYDFYKDHRNNNNNNKLQAKRFMVAKKKRSPTSLNSRDWRYGQEKYLSDPQQLQGANYDYGRYSLPDLLENSQKSYRRYY